MAFRITARIATALAVLGLASGIARAQEIQGNAHIEVVGVNIYDTLIGPNSDGNFRFYNVEQQLRGLTTVDVDSVSNPTGAQFRQTVAYTALPALPAGADSLADGTGTAFGTVAGMIIDAGCGTTATNRSCQGYGGVSTTATGSAAPGFWNLYLGPHTGVSIDAHSFVEVWLRDRCLTTCGDIYAAAGLFAQFAPESTVDPGLPVQSQLVTRSTANALELWDPNITGSGTLLHASSSRDLHLVFENTSNVEVLGRIRWDTQVVGVSAVPEPGSALLWAAGLASFALRRRRAG